MENKINYDAVCPHDEFCGGCTYQGVPYEEQLKTKENEVRSLLRQAMIEPDRFDPIEGCPESSRYAYRNKMEYTFGDMVKGGELCLGMHRIRNFMSIVTVDHCQIVPPDFNRILRFTLDFCLERGYVKYHKKRHDGLLRNLIVRRGVNTGEILIDLVTTSESEFDEEAWKDGLLALSLDGEIVGILHTIDDSIADAVISDETRQLYGRDHYFEEIDGLRFKVHMFSFFQTNVEAATRLYEQALSLIDDFEGKTVFDLYCGTGTISQIAATRAKQVYGVELVPESVDSARENARLNGLDNCEFLCGDVFKVLEQFDGRPDVITVDPPRVGISPDAVKKIASYGVPQIVYISCNPKSLAKNLAEFKSLGYRTTYLKPFDNFPFTKGIEDVTLLSRT